jgi:hypothetical protein
LATKYHALAAAAPVVVAHGFSPGISLRKPGLLKLAMVFAIAAASALLASPYFVLSFREVWANLADLFGAGQGGFVLWQIDPAGGYVFYLKTLIWGLGWPLAGLCAVTAVAALFRRRAVDYVLLCLPWLMFLYLGWQKMFFGRFMLPVVAPLILVSASLLVEAAERTIPKRSWRTAALVGVWLLLAAQPLASSLRFDSLMRRTDTRTDAQAWIEQNIPDGARLAMDWPFHCPALSTADRLRANSHRSYTIWMPDIDDGMGLSDNALDWYRQNGYEYLIACSTIYRLNLSDPQAQDRRLAFYRSLDEELTLVKVFTPGEADTEPDFIWDEMYGPAVSLWQRERPGPTIKIYQLPAE